MLASSQGYRHELLLGIVLGRVVPATADDTDLNALAYRPATLDGRRGVVMRLLDIVKAGLVCVDGVRQVAVLLVRGGRSLYLLDLLTVPHHVSLGVSTTFFAISRCIVGIFFVVSGCSSSSFHPRR